jgi:hypothetical protein
MPHPTQAKTAPANRGDSESITAALLDALCSPQLYDIVMHGGELLIKPRPHMHPQPLAQVAA